MTETPFQGQVTSANSSYPWNPISVSIDDSMSSSDVLSSSRADYDVILSPVQVENLATGKFVTVKDRYVTGRLDISTGNMDNWEVVKGRYEVVPNSEIVNSSIQIVKSSKGLLHLHSSGVLDGGRKFFVVLSSSRTSHLDTNFDHYLVIMTSHDGTSPITYYCIDVRSDTKSIIRFRETETSTWIMKKRHTPTAEDLNLEYKSILDIRSGWTSEFHSTINIMQGLTFTNNDPRVSSIVDSVWPEKDADTPRKMKYRSDLLSKLNSLYNSNHNSLKYGHTGWSLYNAISELIDFNRQIDIKEASQQAFEIDNFAFRKKMKAYDAIMECI